MSFVASQRRRLTVAAIVGSVAVQIPGALYRRCISLGVGVGIAPRYQRVPLPEYQNRGFALCAHLGGRQQVVINSVQNNQPASIVEGDAENGERVKNDSRFIPSIPPVPEARREIPKAFERESQWCVNV